ncbi:hypothetical protein LUZ60_011633 [Juncus effusus]|nr:hypothetical protein LUZ60_011633 [Juncus effusus]
MEASRIMELHHAQGHHHHHHHHPLIDSQVDLEEESINFWATLGVTPHVPLDPPHQFPHHNPSPNPLPVYDPLFPSNPDPRLEPFLGMEFDSAESAKTFYIAYAGRVGFSVRIARSRRSKCSESIIMLRFVCSREGFSKEKPVPVGKKTRKRAPSVREGCQAMLEVLRRTGTGTETEKWVVTKLVKEHSHEVGITGRVHYIETDGDAEVDPCVGMEFDSLESAKTFYYTYANRVGFEARIRQSRKSLHDESLKMLKLVCSKHRYHSSKENTNNGPDSCTKEVSVGGCEALFEIIRKEGDIWTLSKLVLEHTHPLTPTPLTKVRCVRSQGEVLVIAKNFADTRNLLLNGHDPPIFKPIRYNNLGPQDFENLLDYFARFKEVNGGFCYAVQFDKKSERNMNVFWADVRARMACYYFGDAVRFETRYRTDKDERIPVVFFTGLNQHAQLVIFGCGLLVDESEESFIWLFKNWMESMPDKRAPLTFLTELSQPMANAILKVFPETKHLFCKDHVISTLREEISDLFLDQSANNNVYNNNNPFIEEMRSCVERSETVESFELRWHAVIEKYGLRNNGYTCYLYEIRNQWVPAFTNDSFIIGGFRVSQENLNKVVEQHFNANTELRVAVGQLAREVSSWHDLECASDFRTVFEQPSLCTASPIEKQASGLYTRVIFQKFQEEFMQSFGYHVEKLNGECGPHSVIKYQVVSSSFGNEESEEEMHRVSLSLSKGGVKVQCTCRKFESCGILCRHALRVFIVEGIRNLPRDYVLKRWTKHAKSDFSMLDGNNCNSFVEFRGRNYEEDPAVLRYNDLYVDVVRCAKEGSKSEELFKVAKEAIHKALNEVVSAKPHRGPHGLLPQKNKGAGVNGVKRSGSPSFV